MNSENDWPLWTTVSREPCEEILAEGGFGLVGWIALAIFSLVTLMTFIGPLVVIYFVWGRSGRYLLTERRLIFKRNLGAVLVLPADAIRRANVSVSGRRRSLSLSGSAKVSMRFLNNFQTLWGAIGLLGRWQPPAQAPRVGTAPLPDAIAAAHLTVGFNTQTGVAITRPDRVVFIPNTPMQNVGKDVAAGVALALIGASRRTYRAQFPIVRALTIIESRGGDFDGNVERLRDAMGGSDWTETPSRRGSTKEGRVRVDYKRDKQTLTFMANERLLAQTAPAAA